MSNALLHHVAIASESSRISFDDVATVAAAVSKQVARDFGPAWGIQATVQAFPSLESVPSDYYQVILVDDDKMPHAAGYHTDLHGQPLAVVEVAGNWPLAVSHETLEMLADPSGNRIVAAGRCDQMGSAQIKEIVPFRARFDYLVEICDPVESEECAYTINGVPVSNFVLPCFYSSSGNVSDFLGTTAQMSVVDGYLSFRDPADGAWYQIFSDGANVTAHRFYNQPDVTLRESCDLCARQKRGNSIRTDVMRFEPSRIRAARTRQSIHKASHSGGLSAK